MINQAPLTVTANADSKTYDATAYSGGNGVSFSAFAGSESSANLGGTLSYTGSSQSAVNAGTYVITPAGYTSSNYAITFANGALTIDPATLTITAVTNTKTYDGRTTAAATPTYTGQQGSDTVTGLAETYDTRHAGTGKTLSVSAYTVNDGAGGGNYTVSTIADTTGVINQAALTITANADSKTYDATAYSGGNGVVGSGFVGGEGVGDLSGALGYTGTSQGATNAGAYVITPTGYTSSDYAITFANGALTINPATLTITAVTNTKTYDGGITAAATPTVSGLQGSDTATGLAETYDTRHAGTGKTLSVSTYTVNDGAGGGNYTVSTIADTTGVINQAALTITAATNTKTYDTNTSASATPTVSGLQGSDTATGLAETYANATAGTGKTLSVSAYTVNDGAGGGDYTISTVDDTTGVINQAAADRHRQRRLQDL